MKHTLFKV